VEAEAEAAAQATEAHALVKAMQACLVTHTGSDDTSESTSPHCPSGAVEPDSGDASLPASPDLPSIYGSDEEFGGGSGDRPNPMRPTWWEIESEDEQGDDAQ
jgi:hypothetical protein